jgi:hypothetical protein
MPDLLAWLPRLALAAFGLPLLAFAFGWSVLRRARRLDAEERFAAAWGVGVAAIGMAQIIAFMLHEHQAEVSAAVLVLLAVVAVIGFLLPDASGVRLRDCAGLGSLWLLGYLHILLIQALLPDYVGSDWYFDWKMHYDFAQVFLGTRPDDYAALGQYNLASRTPLFNASAGFVLSLTGDEYFSYQITATWLNWLFPAPLYLLMRDRCGVKAARLALLLAPLNLWLLHLAWFTWTKLLTAFYLLLALHFYLRFLRCWRTDAAAGRSMFLGSWVWGLFGFLTHQVAVVYIGAIGLHAAWALRGQWREWLRLRYLAVLGGLGVLLVGGWYAWLFWRFGLHRTSVSSPTAIMANSLTDWLIAIPGNAAMSVVPLHLFVTLFREPWDLASWYRSFTALYFSLVTGALTLSLTWYLGLLAVRWIAAWRDAVRRRTPASSPAGVTSALWAFSGLGCLGILLHPWYSDHGVAHNVFFPSVLVWLAMAWGLLARASRRMAALVLAGMLLEFFLMFWSHLAVVLHNPTLLDPERANASYRHDANLGHSIVFLGELFAPQRPWFILATVVVQGTLVALLACWVWSAGKHSVTGEKTEG